MIWRQPSLARLGRMLRAGERTPTQILEDCLEQIRQHESQIQAWVFVAADAARRSAEALERLLQTGTDLGPLHGIPIGIKDIIDVRGWPTLAGSRLRAGHVAREDAPVVERLRRAGAVILGKTVTTEFACFDPPPTSNPHNPAHTPGGSSSGSAAATALEMCLLAVGSQTGGSITRPASYCGVAGLKPTHGQIDLSGVVPISPRLDHVGPLARSAADLAVGYSLMSGEPIPPVFERWAAPPPRLAIIESFFFEQADDEVSRVTRAAIRRLEDHVRGIVTLPLPDSFAELSVMHRRLMAVDAAQYHQANFAAQPDRYGRHVRALIEEGLRATGVEYSQATAHQQRFRAELAALWPDGYVALAPATPTPAPPTRETTGDPRFNAPWSYCGFPVVNIPCGWSVTRLPCGLQLIGKPHSEWELLRTAVWCENLLAEQI